jgi:hypothetical protein
MFLIPKNDAKLLTLSQTVAQKIGDIGGGKVDLLIKYKLVPWSLIDASNRSCSNAGLMKGAGASFTNGISKSSVEDWEQEVRPRFL